MGKISTIYRIEEGILAGTEIQPFMAFIMVTYPHRKTRDLYVPPAKVEVKGKEKEVKTWHCCQEHCNKPDFEGGLAELLEHLMIHK